jgi:hypothetical protein
VTEAEWLAGTETHPMVEVVRNSASERKLRLFAAACARRVWHLLVHEACRKAVEVGERFADGLAGYQERRTAWRNANKIFGVYLDLAEGKHGERLASYRSELAASGIPLETAINTADAVTATVSPGGKRNGVKKGRYYPGAYGTAAWALAGPNFGTDDGDAKAIEAAEKATQCSLLRDIIGNPFRPPPSLPPPVLAWSDRTVPRIAQGIYDERRLPEGTLDAARLAVLADALLDAGCDDEDLIAHCRHPGPHVRGCWALDLILGKE